MREVKLFSLESACDQSAMLLLQGRRYRAWLIETCDSAAVKPAVQPAVQRPLCSKAESVNVLARPTMLGCWTVFQLSFNLSPAFDEQISDDFLR
jgi:hypothetical protein